jgi:hypothetical protein
MAAMIEDMMKKGGVWFATLAEIAAHVRKVTASGAWKPRVERLPFYDASPIPELRRAAE